MATPEEAAVERAEHGQVARAFGRLAEGDQVVLALRHVERMSEREMATALDCAPGTVKSRLSRATVRLRLQLAAVVAVVAVVEPRRRADRARARGGGRLARHRLHPGRPDAGDRPGGSAPPVGEGLRRRPTAAEVEDGPGRHADGPWGSTPPTWGRPSWWRWHPRVASILALVAGGGHPLGAPAGRADGLPVGPFVKRPDRPAAPGVRDVPGLGDQALVLEGDHVLDTPGRSLAATTAVLWLDEGREFRLEAAVPADRLVAHRPVLRPAPVTTAGLWPTTRCGTSPPKRRG